MEKVKSAPHAFLNVRQLTVSGLLAGITIFLGLTGYGFIPLLFMDATILHIPTIIGSIAAGPRVGALVGFMFGLFSFVQTLRAPSLLLQFAVQYNIAYDAIICIVPRILIGIIAYVIFSRLKGRTFIRAAVAAVVTTVCHTVLFLGTLYFLVGPGRRGESFHRHHHRERRAGSDRVGHHHRADHRGSGPFRVEHFQIKKKQSLRPEAASFLRREIWSY